MWFRLPDNDGIELKDAGSLCQSCYKFWTHQGLEPKRLVHVRYEGGDEITTENHQIPIVICPHCDGDVILRLSKESANESPDR
jgi:hypothetical protein